MFSDVVSEAQCLVHVSYSYSFHSSRCGRLGTWKFGQWTVRSLKTLDEGLSLLGTRETIAFGAPEDLGVLVITGVTVIEGGSGDKSSSQIHEPTEWCTV